jgi:hypothetical protein
MTDFQPDPDQQPQPDDEELPPIATLVEMLQDVLDQLDGVDELLREHRRVAGDDHFTLEYLQLASGRIGMAWSATATARNGLRRREGR